MILLNVMRVMFTNVCFGPMFNFVYKHNNLILITLMFVNVCFGPMFNPGATQFLVAECNILHSTVSSKTSSSFNDDEII